MPLQRIRAHWSGFTGAPGLSTFYALDGSLATGAIHDFFDACAGFIPSDVHIDVDGSGDEIDVATGALTGVWTGVAPATVVGADSNTYAAPAGAGARWTTDTFSDGSRVRGFTYLVPLGPDAFAAGGFVAGGIAADITTAGLALNGAP